ncbi:putative beta-galactosidase A [Mycena sanguinolenta]|uniref:beta-galactosidase n=1 Tax=Mycena sanguinolenta TaxID=230812 RepID=A0A8H6YMD2_9AGAR|nr:putative beta-galactosidase A [Mycena sanguinolenta]
MKPTRLLLALAATSFSCVLGSFEKRQSFENNSAEYVMPVGSPGFYNGRSNASVTLDQHSLLLDGQRVMVFSGEFHPFRLPSPDLWYDILQKFKASGFNGVSVYWYWGLSAPNPNEVRFTQHNDLARFFQVAKDVGILVIVRPGPYINAEAAAGGIPGWATNVPGLARTNNTAYRAAWLPYVQGFAEATAPFQYPDGPVIAVQSENEYATTAQAGIPGLDEHMQDIINVLRAGGITKVPTIHNDKNPAGQYAMPGLGKVDLYGWDGYPLGFDCNTPSVWTELSTQMDTSHQTWNPAEPLALYEWQGGAFSYWSGPGYDECYQLVNEQFANVYYKVWFFFPKLDGDESAILKEQLRVGSWHPEPVHDLWWYELGEYAIYSSYDYGAAISEDRTPTPKLAEIKLQAYFLHASPDYLLVGRVGNGTVGSGTAYSASSDIYTTNLESPVSKANFYFVRQSTNTKTSDTDFTLRVNTTLEGEITIPKQGNLTLAGRESKIIVTNYPFGRSTLEYATAEVLTWATFDQVDTIVLYALEGQYVEISVESAPGAKISHAGSTTISAKPTGKTTTVSGSPSGLTVVTFGNTRIIVGDKKTVSGFFAPRLTVSGTGHSHYDLGPDVSSVLVLGPYLVRSATAHGPVLQLTGDLNATTTLDVFAPKEFTSITWNGATVQTTKSDIGSLRGEVKFPAAIANATIPVLANLEWKCADSLPELDPAFDDSTWVLANKTTTQRPLQPTAGKFVLYTSEYGFHAGHGFSFGYSVFINSHFLGSGQGSSIDQSGVDLLSPTFNFTQDQLVDGDNVLTVIHDSTGLNEDYNINDEHKTPRGIRGYTLLSDTGNDFTEWRLAGNIGGENAPDDIAVELIYVQGGWWYERVGAHLPGYDDSAWTNSCTPLAGIDHVGVMAYRTTFNLDLPTGSDIPLAFDFALDSVDPYRTLLYVNGWQFGRFVSSLGPQVSYPIPEGILNHHGTNQVLVSLWALNATGAKMSQFELNKRATVASSKVITVDIVPAPGWAELRGNVTTN